VIYRTSDSGQPRSKLPYSNNWSCLGNAVREFGEKNMIIIADNVNDETFNILKTRFGFKDIYRTKLGNSGSFRFALDLALGFDDNCIVYFLENDYIHRMGSAAMLREAFDLKIDYVTLYDYPDKYCEKHEDTKLLKTAHSHWRTIPSTTMTFAAKTATIKEDCDVIKAAIKKSETETKRVLEKTGFIDYFVFRKLVSERGRILISPVPGFSTHTEKMWLSPMINWAKQI